MTTEKYKCIAHDSSENTTLTIGKEYDVSFEMPSHPKLIRNDLGFNHTFNLGDFNFKFQKVEPNKNKFWFNYPPITNNKTTTQPMKYKVTITSTDHTGHEDTTTHENQTEYDVCHLIEEMRGSTFHIEPMPEKKKVTVWFYVAQDGKDIWSISKVSFEAVKNYREIEIIDGHKVSQIQSMEVEI
jgi:hypothetical protein